MKKTAVAVLMSAALVFTAGAVAQANKAEADEAQKIVYDVSKDYPGATGDYVAVVGSGGPEWYYQALNTYEFHIYGAEGQNAETGALTTDNSNTTLQLYPMIRNGNQGNGVSTSMADGSGNKNLDYLVQYPAGYGIAYNDAEVGTGTFTASQQYANIFGGQQVHPGVNLAMVYAFKAPRAGSVYLQDEVISAQLGGDGVQFAIFHQPANCTSIGFPDWGGFIPFSLYGATPIYPEAKVAPQANGTGWQYVPAGGSVSYTTDNFDVAAGDMIYFVLDAAGTITNDLTYFTPAVIYPPHSRADRAVCEYLSPRSPQHCEWI